jgi:hypothetical protein
MIFFFFISWDFKHQNSGKEKEKSWVAKITKSRIGRSLKFTSAT